MSFLAKELQKNARLLEKGAQKHIEDVLEFENRVSESENSIKDLFLSVSEVNYEELDRFIKNYFGLNIIKFTAIDGTMFKTSIANASIFFSGAYEASGFIHSSESGINIEYRHDYTNKGRGITSVIPLNVTEIVEIDTQFDLDILHSDAGVQSSEDVLLDQSSIADSVMLFSEYFLAYRTLVESTDPKAHILLLDRTISGDHSALIARTQKQVLWKKTVNLIGYKLKSTKWRPFDENDFFWARWFMANHFDPIRPYLKFRILKLLLDQQKSFTQAELSELFHISRGSKNDLANELKFLERKKFIIKKDKLFSLNSRYKETWTHIKELVLEIGARLFFTVAEELETKSPFLITKQGPRNTQIEKWLTTRDLAFLTLFCQYMIIEWLWNNKGLVLGLSKDTAARDFRRQLLPIASAQQWIPAINPDVISLPQGDRAFLQQYASNNADLIPWMLVEYDAVYRTITHDGDFVIGAKSNLSGVMKLFAKSYVQLKQSKVSGDLQSHVLLVDRIIHPWDLKEKNQNIKTLSFKKSEKEEFRYDLNTFYPINNSNNILQKFILTMLVSMTPHSIPEAFGYNRPLFIADKVAKFYLTEFKRLLVSMSGLLGNNMTLRKEAYANETFRNTREEMEKNRAFS